MQSSKLKNEKDFFRSSRCQCFSYVYVIYSLSAIAKIPTTSADAIFRLVSFNFQFLQAKNFVQTVLTTVFIATRASLPSSRIDWQAKRRRRRRRRRCCCCCCGH